MLFERALDTSHQAHTLLHLVSCVRAQTTYHPGRLDCSLGTSKDGRHRAIYKTFSRTFSGMRWAWGSREQCAPGVPGPPLVTTSLDGRVGATLGQLFFQCS